MTDRIFSVAIDGPAGAGKSTVARRAAEALGICYVDTGAIYRTVAFAVAQSGVDCADERQVEALLSRIHIRLRWTDDGVQHSFLNDEDVSSLIRSPEVSQLASRVSALASVRRFLLEMQREVARTNSVIMDGRDIGTVVLPQADVKIYLSASAETRAKRRWLELREKGLAEPYEDVLREMLERDERDMNRKIAPLRRAEDAVLLDTSALTPEESIAAILNIIREKVAI